jgi:trehalose synthase
VVLQLVPVEPKSLRDYISLVGEEAIEEIYELAKPLKGARVLHVNATAFGGGVAELLSSIVPLLGSLGLDVEWRVIYGTDAFFRVTKSFHNALQGAPYPLRPEAQRNFLDVNKLNAEALKGDYDFVVMHDPQTAAMLHYLDRQISKHWIWRCHIDTSQPNPAVLEFLRPYLEEYDAAIFTLPRFVPAEVDFPAVFFITPTIDPLTAKNRPFDSEEARRTVTRFKIDPSRPLVTQVSRFDPWKDPLGVIDAYRMVKVEVPDLQLALVGSMATDDPEGWDYYERTVRHAGSDYDIHILHNFQGVGSKEVNAFQTASDVIVQKSLREGFGLVVTEALWKGKALVAGNAGGIPLQVLDGETGYLVENKLQCAERIHQLLSRPELRDEVGRCAREHVRQNYLSTQQIKDYLQMFTKIQEKSEHSTQSAVAVSA